ncbi:beta-mannosidase [Streptomyces sp. CA-111067]|uniref:glycoside hydrolase 5 family protein n=1 Tax=Streptomyces sp. CA-111067 TaxID=3240046 RepID=UPI003D99A68F
MTDTPAQAAPAWLADRPWLGVNYWSRCGGPRMWDRYDPRTVEDELTALRQHGIGVTRSFLYWPDFMPAPDRLDERLLDRYQHFLDLHARLGMRTVPTLIVGHMSGQNWDPAWRAGRDAYSDVWFVGRQSWFAERIARRFAGHPAVAGWLLSNEMIWYGGFGEVETVTTWAQLLTQGLRAGGATEPIAPGDGGRSIELSGQDSGFRTRELLPWSDWLGPHVYPDEADPVTAHLHAAFVCALAATLDRPVVVEEFGWSTDLMSDENIAHHYRQILHTTLLEGARGWLGWNAVDLDPVAGQDPYLKHPHELHFGVLDAQLRPKPVLEVFAGFAATLDAAAGAGRAPAATALVVPAQFDSWDEFVSEAERVAAFRAMRSAWIAARSADLAVRPVRESAGLSGDERLYLVPSPVQLSAPSWSWLAARAEAGATVLVTRGTGGTPGLDQLFGVRHELRRMRGAQPESGEVALRLTVDVGPLPAGTTLRLHGSGTAPARLDVQPDGAQVLAVDGDGRPALLRRPVGDGAMVLCAYQLEALADGGTPGSRRALARLYDALASEAGVERPWRSTSWDVLIDALQTPQGDPLVWAVNLSGDPVATDVLGPDGGPLVDRATGKPVGTLELAPYAVAVIGPDLGRTRGTGTGGAR